MGFRTPFPRSALLPSLEVPGLAALLLAGPVYFGGAPTWTAAWLLAGSLALLTVHVLRKAQGGLRPSARTPLDFPLLLLLLVGLLQIVPLPPWLVAALSPEAARVQGEAQGAWTLSLEPGATRETLLRHGAGCAVFLLAAALPASRSRLSFFAGAVAVLGAAEAAYGISEWSSGAERVLGIEKPLFAKGRATGTYVYANSYAGLLAMTAPVALGLALSLRPFLGGPAGPPSVRLAFFLGRPRGWGAFTLLACAALAATGSVLSLSRGGVAALLLGVTVFALLARLVPRGPPVGPAAPRGVSRALLIAGSVVLSALILGAAFGGLREFGSRASRLHADLVGTGAESGRGPTRADLAHASSSLAGEFPLVGAGLGAFEGVFPRYLRVEVPGGKVVDHAHSDPLEVACEAGVPAAAFLALGAFVLLVRVARRISRARDERAGILACGFAGGCVAACARAVVDFDFVLAGNAVLAAALFGFAWSAGRLSTPGFPGGRRTGVDAEWRGWPLGPSAVGRFAAAAVPLAVAVVAVPFALRAAEADRLARPVSGIARDSRRAQERRDDLVRAVSLRPDSASLRALLAESEVEAAKEEAGRTGALLEAALRGDASPPEVGALLDLALRDAQLRVAADGLARSLRTTRDAVALAPARPALHEARARRAAHLARLLGTWGREGVEGLPGGGRASLLEEARLAAAVAVARDPWNASRRARLMRECGRERM